MTILNFVQHLEAMEVTLEGIDDVAKWCDGQVVRSEFPCVLVDNGEYQPLRAHKGDFVVRNRTNGKFSVKDRSVLKRDFIKVDGVEVL